MDENLLGRNIKHLREMHVETLDELGAIIHCAKSTVKGYENGSRKPDLQTLNKLSSHYNKTVDELINSDLTDFGEIAIDLNSRISITELTKLMFPLFCSEKAMKSDDFCKGYELSQKLLNSFAKSETLPGDMIVRIFEYYFNAIDESEAPEAAANLMWSIFIWWSQIYDTHQLLSLQNKLLSKKLSFKDFIKLRDTENNDIKEKRVSFVSDFEEIIVAVLKALKSEQEWSDLADYYLALRYVLGMVNTELPNEMNLAVGMQMMVSFMELGNRHAFSFCKTCYYF